MGKQYPEYCAAIRTLGKSGDKYLTTLQSLCNQTVKPKKILVYIAEGYALPKETVGIEQYIYCKKGMVAQRSVSYEEADTDYLLLLDDDIYLPESGVENMFNGLTSTGGKCITLEIYHLHEATVRQKLRYAIEEWILPSKSAKWGFRVRKSSSFSYRTSPKQNVYPTQSGAGGALLCEKQALLSIHLEYERWIDAFRYALGEDQLLYYKLHLYGHKVLLQYNSGIEHLDARTSNQLPEDEFAYNSIKLNFIVWWRTQLMPAGIAGKIACATAFLSLFLWQALFRTLFALKKHNLRIIRNHFAANIDGLRYVRSPQYKAYPPFTAHLREKQTRR